MYANLTCTWNGLWKQEHLCYKNQLRHTSKQCNSPNQWKWRMGIGKKKTQYALLFKISLWFYFLLKNTLIRTLNILNDRFCCFSSFPELSAFLYFLSKAEWVINYHQRWVTLQSNTLPICNHSEASMESKTYHQDRTMVWNMSWISIA